MSDNSRFINHAPPPPGSATIAPYNLLHYLHDAAVATDPAGRITIWNPAAENLYGWSAPEAIGQRLLDLLPDDAGATAVLLQQAQATGRCKGELRHRHRDGHTIVVMAAMSLIRGLYGEPAGMVTTYRDMGEQQATTAALHPYAARLEELTSVSRALAQQAGLLREQAETLSRAYDAAELGTWHHDLASNRIRLDARSQAHYGFETATVTLAELLARVHPADAERLQDEIASMIDPAGDGRCSTEYRVLHPDGTTRWLAVRARVYGAERSGAHPVGVGAGTTQDITARKQAEEELHRSTERLRTLHIVDRAILSAQTPERIAAVATSRLPLLVPCERVAVLTFDGEPYQLRVLTASDVQPARNPEGTQIPVTPQDLLAPFALGKAWYVPDTAVVEGLSPRAIDYRALGLRSLIHVPLIAEGRLLGALRLGTARPDAFSKGDLVIAGEVANQIAIALRSARIHAQLEQERALLARRVAERTADLSAANEELARAARLKDEFLASMSHELRTPLNAVLGRSEILRERIYGPLTPQQDTAIQSIEEAGRHLLALINDILDLSKIEAGMLQLETAPVEIEQVGRAALRMVNEAALRRHITLSTRYETLAGQLIADERRLKQILVNLLANAIKFTPADGKVGLAVCGDPAAQTVTFTVWDTGIGIAPEDQRRLFQPFVQLDSALNRHQSGTGLGLALVQRLAALHGGSVTLESEIGAGSSFHVVLPLGHTEPPAGPPGDRTAPGAHFAYVGARAPLPAAQNAALPNDPGGGITAASPVLLLAEDHAANVRVLEEYLTAAGYTVILARNGAEAVAMATAQRPALILMDVQMPMMDGLEATRRIRASGLRNTPIIAVTALAMRGDRERCLEAGADAYLTKPVSLRALRELIEQLLHQHGP